MQVEMSLAELLINAIAHGKVPGVQFKRGWSDDRATFDGLNAVIGSRLDGARRVAVEQELRKLHDEHPGFKTRARVKALEESLEYTLRIIDYELPPQPDPQGDDGEASSQFYRFEGLRTARALLPKAEEPEATFAAVLSNGEDKP